MRVANFTSFFTSVSLVEQPISIIKYLEKYISNFKDFFGDTNFFQQ